jgi:hypothetical protein
MNNPQMSFLPPPTAEEKIETQQLEIKELKRKLDHYRRSMYANFGEVEKKIEGLEGIIDDLVEAIQKVSRD